MIYFFKEQLQENKKYAFLWIQYMHGCSGWGVLWPVFNFSFYSFRVTKLWVKQELQSFKWGPPGFRCDEGQPQAANWNSDSLIQDRRSISRWTGNIWWVEVYLRCHECLCVFCLSMWRFSGTQSSFCFLFIYTHRILLWTQLIHYISAYRNTISVFVLVVNRHLYYPLILSTYTCRTVGWSRNTSFHTDTKNSALISLCWCIFAHTETWKNRE